MISDTEVKMESSLSDAAALGDTGSLYWIPLLLAFIAIIYIVTNDRQVKRSSRDETKTKIERGETAVTIFQYL